MHVCSLFTSLGRALGADLATKEKERGMSSAMRMYLQRKKEHDMFISRERAEFEVGKQHLAGMMGLFLCCPHAPPHNG